MIKLELSTENQNFGELVFATLSMTVFQYLKTFVNRVGGDITMHALILYNEVCQHLEDLQNSVNQYITND